MVCVPFMVMIVMGSIANGERDRDVRSSERRPTGMEDRIARA